jgi:hypothetical protein
MNEFECVISILNVRSFARSMGSYFHQLGFQRESFDALR